MERGKWEQVKYIFDAALKCAPDERELFLSKNCNGDDELRGEVESLLSSFDSAKSFLQKPAVAEVADVVIGANNQLSEGQRISHYQIIKQIGAGGMGEVYLAEDTKLNRRVAIKLLPTSLSSDQNANRRLLREARAAATLDHPHICQIHEIAETDGRSFIVMQHVEGETLAEKLERENLTLGETLDLAIQIADALANVHSHHVIHRDIKPANIINNQGRAKILDFGLAKILSEKLNVESEAEAAQSLSTANMIIGTVPYMSPEQVCGKPLDARTDIFSFGVLLYEMLSGKNLFNRESQAETISAVLNYEPPIAKTLADAPQELQRIVRKALIKNRDERYQTAKDLLVDLKALQKHLEFEAELFRERENVVASSNISASPRPSVSESPLPPNNLSENLSPIVGREKEITAILDLLQSENIQLVTMTGIGGTGKTRLAQAVARRMLTSFDDGVFFIELAAITDAELVVSTTAQLLGMKEAGGKPILEILKDYLRDKRVLIVVDNFEQVIDAGPKIAELLTAASKLKILITSRVPLHLSAEREFIVPPLTVPSANLFDDYSPVNAVDPDLLDDLQKYEAVKLFIERARNAKSNFALTAENARSVAEICACLDGLPLAIELAAVRIKVLSPQAIFTKLKNRLKLLTGGARDLPARQQTMRGAIKWSHELLTEDEKRLFRRLAVFAGGFTIESAEAVCADYELQITNDESSEDQIEVLDLITSLVDKSLLVSKEQANGESRFRMLEVVHEYALESLETNGEAEAMCQSHAAYFLALGEEAEPHLQEAQSAEWFNRLEEEHDNLQAALWWSCQFKIQIAARLTASLRKFWIHHGHLKEGRKWFEEALKLGDNIPVSVHLKLLNGAGNMAQFQGDHKTAKKMYEEGLAVSKRAGDLRQVALSNRGLGAIAEMQGDFMAAREYVEESLAISRKLNDLFGIAASLNRLGDIASTEGNYAKARPLFEESLAFYRQLGKKDSVSNSLNNLGAAAFGEGDFVAARSHFVEALTMARELGDKTIISYALDDFAALAVERGDAQHAAQLSGAAEHLRESMGLDIGPPERRFRAAYLAELKTKLDEAAFTNLYEQGRKLKLDEAIALALAETGEAQTAILTPATSNPQETPATATKPDSQVSPDKPETKRKWLLLGLLSLFIFTAGFFAYRSFAPSQQIESIAVMPFVNESGSADVEYLSDGMTETLINSLSQIPNLNVKARSTVFYYKGKKISPQKIGEELKVQAVLLGRVVQRGNDLKLSLELVNTQTQDVIWSETYNRKQSDLVSLQSEIAQDVLSKLKIRLTGADEQKLAKKSTENAEAYQLYIQGRYEWNKFSLDSLKKSIPLFERAIQIDPTFALAYSGLADSYVNLGVDYTSAHDTMPQARVAAIQAIALDDSLAEAHTSLGSYKMFYEWDIKGAEEEYQKAISLDAKYGNAHHFYSHCLQFSGKEAEAIREMKTAVELEPLSLVNNSELGWAYYLANQHDAAIEHLHKTVKLDPSYSFSYFTLGLVYADKGNYTEAVAALREGQRLSPDWLELQAVLAYTYASAGERGEAEALLTKLLKSAADTYVNPVLIAGVYVALADNDRAIEWLERGYREKCSWMRWIAIEPQLKRLQPDPRFQNLVSRVNR